MESGRRLLGYTRDAIMPYAHVAALLDEVKLFILRHLTVRALEDAMLVDRHTCTLAAAVRREKLSALTVFDSEELFLSPHAVRWALSAAPRFRMLLQLPSFSSARCSADPADPNVEIPCVPVSSMSPRRRVARAIA